MDWHERNGVGQDRTHGRHGMSRNVAAVEHLCRMRLSLSASPFSAGDSIQTGRYAGGRPKHRKSQS